MPPPDPLGLVGRTIADKYAIESVVGEGGFAIVYKAQHKLWKRPVAVKVFKALGEVREADRGKLLEEFVREGALLAELSERSAAIVQARDIGTTKGPKGEELPYMVLEWLEGATLDAVLWGEREAGMPLRTIDETVRLLDLVAEALALAHARGIAHRDVKPANVFVLGDPRAPNPAVKLLDFGIAKVVQDVQKMAGAFSKTAGQITSFTPSYGAPEQFNRAYGATGPWTDVFALALVVVEVLTGKEPLPGDNLVQLAFTSADKTNRPTPRARGANVSDEVERVLARAVAVAPDDRPKNAGEMWSELRTALRMGPMRDVSVPPPAVASTHPLPPSTAPGIDSARTEVQSTVSHASAATTVDPVVPRTSRAPLVAIALAALVLGGVGAGAFVLRVRGRAPPRVSAGPAATSAPAPIASIAPATLDASTCPEGMIRIPGGMFFMGSEEHDAVDNEKPVHQVTLAPYCIGTHEVTARDYNACRDRGACKKATFNAWPGLGDKDRAVYDPLCNGGAHAESHATHPINCVAWEMADRYCKQEGGRLPTEAEWEFAARGPDSRKYPWGDEPPSKDLLNACGTECTAWGTAHGVKLAPPMYKEDDRFPTTAPVGSFPKGKSRYGVEDVVGNVWEWVSDYYAPYDKDNATNPPGPASGTERVVRGGAWNGTQPSWVRPTFRFKDDPEKRSFGIGFRCARSL